MNDDVKKLGEPLTIEELRGMDGQPVWLSVAGGVWGIVCVSDGCVVVRPSQEIDIAVLDGLAYRYLPVATDTNVGSKLKEWEPCEFCRDWHLEKVNVKPCGNGDMGVYAEVGKVNNDEKTGIVIFCDNLAAGYVEFDFCPFCGKPQTEEARTMLEKRLRG